MTTFGTAAFLGCLAMAWPGSALAHADGGSRPTQVTVPRLEAGAQIDGALDESQWQRAAVLSGFYQFLPSDGRPAEDSSHVLVWYAPRGIYFGIRAFERHGPPRATLADRDRIQTDDYVLLVLDTFNDRRQAFFLGVNPFGVQWDGILRDASPQTGVIASSDEKQPYSIDPTPDFVYESVGRLTDYGYEVEIFVPFKSLRYQSKEDQEWGFNVVRQVQHSGFIDSWSPVLQDNVSFLSQCGTLVGLSDLRRGLVLDINPEITSSVDGTPGAETWTYSASNPEPGINLRWGVTNNLSLNATANPDFSQVEADVAKIAFDPRRALFFPEKRPFFLDGIELFHTPQRLIYTRRVTQPVGAVKLTGKEYGVNVGFLSAVDRRSTSITGDDYRFFNALRISADVWSQSTLGMAYTDKLEGDRFNRVASVDGRLVIAEKYSVTFQGAGSFTREEGQSGTEFAPLWTIEARRSGRRFGVDARVTGAHADFNAETGFISRTDVASAKISPRTTFYGKDNSVLETFSGSVDLIGSWVYDDFTRARKAQDRQVFVTARFGLRGGWSIGPSILIERFGYPAELYSDYYIERRDESGAAIDTVAFTGTPNLYDLSYAFNVITPRFSTFSGGAYIFYGRDVNWWEWAGADLFIIDMELNWTPTDRLRANLLYNHVQYIRPNDRSMVQIRRIPRLKVEYQLTRSIFLRVVGQYDSNAVDALRDNSRTEDPILRPNDDGELERVAAFRTNDFRIDWLFSYRPTPGTVFFFGYGSSLSEPDSFRFRNLDRVSDGFFLKLSYLFRV